MKIIERNKDNSYFMFDIDHYCSIHKEREKRGLKCFDLAEDRVKEKVPSNLPNLKKAFDDLPFKVGDKFIDNTCPDREYHVQKIYWQYYDGYYIEMLVHYHYDKENPENESHGTRIIRNVNSPFAEENIFNNYTKVE